MATIEKEKILDVIRQMVADGQVSQEVAEKYFPELKESEDERIKKALIKLVKKAGEGYENVIDGVSIENAISWLEKQGEQKPLVIIPKFRVGDEVETANEEPLTITKIDTKGYWSEDLFICSFDDASNWELVAQKPAWSEEDEKMYNAILRDVRNGEPLDKLQYDWLKSLSPQKKQEWNWDDANILRDIDHILKVYKDKYHGTKSIEPIKEWLSSLNPQKQWKPSDEQIRILELAIDYWKPNDVSVTTPLYNLLEQLKKLMLG